MSIGKKDCQKTLKLIKIPESDVSLNCSYDRKRLLVRSVLWIMAVYYFVIITRFSARTAVQSSMESNGILEKIILFLTGADMNEIDKELFHTLHSMIRKLAHFANFFILGFIYTMLANETSGGKSRSVIATVLLCGFISAIIDEGHQYFVPGRSAQIQDVFIDFSGVFTGCILFVFMRKVFRC